MNQQPGRNQVAVANSKQQGTNSNSSINNTNQNQAKMSNGNGTATNSQHKMGLVERIEHEVFDYDRQKSPQPLKVGLGLLTNAFSTLLLILYRRSSSSLSIILSNHRLTYRLNVLVSFCCFSL